MIKPNLHITHSAPLDPSVNMTNPSLITHALVAETFQDAFRRRVGRGENKVSIANLADAIDMNARTIKSWRDGYTLPQIMGLMRLCAHFGPAFASELLSPAGLGGVEVMTPVKADPDGTAADLIAAAHGLMERLRDGTFCHRDRAEMGPELLELSRELEAQGNAMMRGDT